MEPSTSGAAELADTVDAAAVLHAARTGQESALAELYERHGPALLRYFRALNGARGDVIAARVWIAAARRLSRLPLAPMPFRVSLLVSGHDVLEHERNPTAWSSADTSTRLPRGLRIEPGSLDGHVVGDLAGDAAASQIADTVSDLEGEVLLLIAVCGCSIGEVACILNLEEREVESICAKGSELLVQAFGAAGANRLLDRAAELWPAPAPPGLITAMAKETGASEPGTVGRGGRSVTRAAIVAAVLIGSATSAAAATGSLPQVVQQPVADLVSHLGISLPQGHDTPRGDPGSTGTPPEGTGPASVVEGDPSQDTHGSDVSDVAKTTEAEGADKGAEISDAARGEHGPEQSGPPEDTGKPDAAGKPDAPGQPADAPAPAAEPAPQAPADEPVQPPTTAPGDTEQSVEAPESGPSESDDPRGRPSGTGGGRPDQPGRAESPGSSNARAESAPAHNDTAGKPA